MSASPKVLRPIRSFVRREGRLTSGQQRALTELWPQYGIDAGESILDFSVLFARRAPVILEIGFGNGDALCAMATAQPENNYLGLEVHRPGVGRLLQQLKAQAIDSARVMAADAKQVLEKQIPAASLAGVHIFFPDPWPKARHHKRRLIQPEFAALLQAKLAPGGYLHLATDWQHYAEHMLSVLSQTPGLINSMSSGGYTPRPDYRPLTKFEQRGQKLGHGVWDLVFYKVA